MTVNEILLELPKLSAEEINQIFFRAAELRQATIGISAELSAAIDEADTSFEKEGGYSVSEIEEMVKKWPI